MKNLPELKDLGRADPGLCGIFKSGQLLPRGSIYTAIMELGPQNRKGDGLLGPDSIIVVYMDPLGYFFRNRASRVQLGVSCQGATKACPAVQRV